MTDIVMVREEFILSPINSPVAQIIQVVQYETLINRVRYNISLTVTVGSRSQLAIRAIVSKKDRWSFKSQVIAAKKVDAAYFFMESDAALDTRETEKQLLEQQKGSATISNHFSKGNRYMHIVIRIRRSRTTKVLYHVIDATLLHAEFVQRFGYGLAKGPCASTGDGNPIAPEAAEQKAETTPLEVPSSPVMSFVEMIRLRAPSTRVSPEAAARPERTLLKASPHEDFAEVRKSDGNIALRVSRNIAQEDTLTMQNDFSLIERKMSFFSGDSQQSIVV